MPTETMETNDTSFDQFFDALDSESGYQTETEPEAQETAPAEDEPVQEGAEPAEDAPAAGDDTDPTTEGDPAAAPAQAADSFTLRVNHSDMTVTRDQMIEYAQKGVDYDRVRAALEQEKNANSVLRSQQADTQKTVDRLSSLAKDCNLELPDLLEQFEIAMYQRQGLSPDAAKERAARVAAERKLEEANAQKQTAQDETMEERANREIAEFAQRYPGVEPTKELAEKLAADIQNGMTLTQAYEKHLSAEKDAEIQRLKTELEAEKQNNANRASSPGSMQDQGSRKVKDQFDDFFGAFD